MSNVKCQNGAKCPLAISPSTITFSAFGYTSNPPSIDTVQNLLQITDVTTPTRPSLWNVPQEVSQV